MAQKAETNFKVRVKAFLKTLPNTWHVKIQQVGLRGTPDLLCCVNGVFVAIELKASRTAPLDRLQAHTLKQIKKAGGTALVAFPENWPVVQEALKTAWQCGERGLS